MLTRHSFKNSTWIELDHPTDEDVRSVMDEYGLHIDVAKALSKPSLRQKIERYDQNLYLILHFPAFKHTHGEENVQEIDFVIGRDYVITVKYDTIDTMHKFSKVVEAETLLDRTEMFDRPQFIFFGLLREIYKSLYHEVSYLDDWANEIERNIFKHKEREMVFALSRISRSLLDLRRVLDPHSEMLESLEAVGRDMFGEDFAWNVSVISTEYSKVRNLVKNNFELVHELRETNNSLLTTKQNEVMKIFTILAFVTFPLSLMASIFGMNTQFTPFVGHPHDFWLVILIMAMATTSMYTIFKYKKWI